MVTFQKRVRPRRRRREPVAGTNPAGWYYGMLRRFSDRDDLARGPLPDLTYERILEWADRHRERTGEWPITLSGDIPEAECPGETWVAVEAALAFGARGLGGHDTLARLLARERGKVNRRDLARLSVSQVLEWADEHHGRTGEWPIAISEGEIPGSGGVSWPVVCSALYRGCRGLPGGMTLPQLLAVHRGVRNKQGLPNLTIRGILGWARADRERTHRWPKRGSGDVSDAPGETWGGVDSALQRGQRGLRGGSSLQRLLAKYVGARNHMALPRLTIDQILAWADEYKARAGRWPKRASGRIRGARYETWATVNRALTEGGRGLDTQTSLAKLLLEERGVRNVRLPPPLSLARILAWADDHQRRTGGWPTAERGAIAGASDESWQVVDLALRQGRRGLPGGSSLAQLLAASRGVRNRLAPPPLEPAVILEWARAHHERTGSWPGQHSGQVVGGPGESWSGITQALIHGRRGLPGGLSLSGLLWVHCGVPSRTSKSRLTMDRILSWARSHHRRSGRWPTCQSGSIVDAPGETWQAVDLALRRGQRGLAGGQSLSRLLGVHCGVRRCDPPSARSATRQRRPQRGARKKA